MQALQNSSVEFFEGVASVLEALLSSKDCEDRTEVLGCFASREFVDILLLKLGGYDDRLTHVILQILLLTVQHHHSKLTVAYQHLKAALQPHAVVLSELFEDYESSEHFSKRVPVAIHRLLELFVCCYEIEFFEDNELLATFSKRLLVRIGLIQLYSITFSDCSAVHSLLVKLIRFLLDRSELYSKMMLVELRLLTLLWNAYEQQPARSSCKATCLRLFDMLLESSTDAAIDQQLIECSEWDLILEVLKQHLLRK